jgi:PKD repeat protein
MRQFLLLLFSISFLSLFSQEDENIPMGKTCYTTELNEKLIDHYNLYDIYEQKQEEYKSAAKQWSLTKSNRAVNADRTVTVVVHVVRNPNNTNDPFISDAEIHDMIEIMTQDYTRTNPDENVTRDIFQGVASSAEMVFCLANTDPNGNATTGIVRVDVDEDFFDPNTEANEMKLEAGAAMPAGSQADWGTQGNGSPAWDPDRYCNIWICNLSNGAGQGVAGYAYMPGGAAGQWYDGLVVDAGIGVNVYNGMPNRTATHEVGHYFGLSHTWGDGDCSVDDGLNDTPLSGNDNSTVMDCNPNPEPNTCGAGNPGDLPDQYENYMSYASCQNMFSAEQAALMNGVLDTDRSGIVDNGLCAPSELTADFTPNTPTITINAGESITFTDASNGPDGIATWDWTFEEGTPNTANSGGSHTITYNNPGGPYEVSLTVGDNNGDFDTKTEPILVEVLDILNANFSANITYAEIGQVINFTDLSSGPAPIVDWEWNFGDGNIDNTQNPTHAYSNAGEYTVTLTVDDGTDQDVEEKTLYIEVYDPNLLNIIDFVGIPTTINVNETVNFEVETNQPDNIIDSIRWVFQGADDPFVYKENTIPFDVSYSTGGIFDVEVRVYRDGGMDGDTLIKEDYITVIAPENIPVANFSATNTNIEAGSTIDFINLTTNIDIVTSFEWIIETEPGIFVNSTDINPTGINYPVVGDFDVQLAVTSPYGDHDTLKLGYIHVFDASNLGSVTANFTAVTPRLIEQGETVFFEDLSSGDIQDWTYKFERGAETPAYEFGQNPEHLFLEAGFYDVTLIVSNADYADTITKEKYIIVTTNPWPNPVGYCDTITALDDDEIIKTYREAEYPSWGYFPGHYAKKDSEDDSPKYIKRYAQKFETYTPDLVSAVVLPVAKAFDGDEEAEVRMLIWNATPSGLPNEVISGATSNKIKINTLQERMYNYIELEEPVEVDSVFFVGFRIDYKSNTSPQDTFATYMAPERPNAEDNSLYVSKFSSGNTEWQTPTGFLGFELNTALSLKILGCVVNVPEIAEIEASLDIYPNPAQDRIFIDFNDQRVNQIKVNMYDIVGKKVNTSLQDVYDSKYELDISEHENGFYLVNIEVNGYTITKKILIQK